MDVGDGSVDSLGRWLGALSGGEEKTDEKNPRISKLGNPRFTHDTKLDARYARSKAFWEAGVR